MVLLARELPGTLVATLLAQGKINWSASVLEDIRDEGLARVVQGLVSIRDLAAAESALRRIRSGSPHYQRALFELGMGTAGDKGWKQAAPIFNKLTEPKLKARVQLVSARLSAGIDHDYDKALELFTKVANSNTRWAAMARVERSMMKLRREQKLPPLAAVPELVVAMVYYDYCRQGPLVDALAGIRDEAAKIRTIVEPLRGINDRALLFTTLRTRIAQGGLSDRAQELLRTALAKPEIVAAFAWHDRLARELRRLKKSDNAWRSTQLAAEIEGELAARKALAAREAGEDARGALARLIMSLDAFARWTPRIPTVTDPSRPGLLVAPTSCPKSTPTYQRELARRRQQMRQAPDRGMPPPPAAAHKKGGCAGCNGGGAPGGMLLVLIGVLFAARRRSPGSDRAN
jgi:hypothetical protein